MSSVTTPRRRWSRIVALVAAIALLGTFLVLGSLDTVQVECSLCVTYQGQTDCRAGSGADEAEARQAAMKAACGLMARGMTETVACQNATPTNVQCQVP